MTDRGDTDSWGSSRSPSGDAPPFRIHVPCCTLVNRMTVGETGAWFQTTSWALVQSAQGSRADMEILLRAYWSPVYAFIRKKGYGYHDAADLTQEFLAEVLVGRDLIGKADPS